MTRCQSLPDLKMLIYAVLPVGVTQPKYNYSVQICYTMLLTHWATTQISPMTALVQNGYLFRHILVSYPLIFTNFPFWHPICTMMFVIATAVCLFQANCSLFLSTCTYGNDYIVAPTSTRTDVPEVTFRALIVIIRNDVFSPSDSMLSIIMFITVACYATLYM